MELREDEPTYSRPTELLPLKDLLKAELARRCHKNPSYSLRSFAKSLELSPAFVSKLLKGDRPFTDRTLRVLAEKIPLDPEQLSFYQKRQRLSLQPKAEAQGYRKMSLDQFQLISDWYHFAILELTTVEGFDSAPAKIAKRLGISIYEASAGLDRLLRLGYLHRNANGDVALTEMNNTVIGPEIAVPATKNQQTQILELAIRALTETPIEIRSQSSMTMAIPEQRLAEAKQLITEFRRRFTDLMQRPSSEDAARNAASDVQRDSVYQLSISFFPLTKTEKKIRGEFK